MATSGISDLILKTKYSPKCQTTPSKQKQYAQFAYQQQRRVDVDVLKHNELFLHFDREQPWTVQFSFHPVSHTAVLPFKGSGQSPDRQDEVRGSEGGLWLCCYSGYSLEVKVLMSAQVLRSFT